MPSSGYTDVCLIEDDPIMGESVVNRFELEDLSIQWLRTAEEARNALKQHDYGVVVSDIRLRDLNGDLLFEQLKQQLASLPSFIFITGFGDVERAVSLLKVGAADYLTKPFDIEYLLARVRELLPGFTAMQDGDSEILGISPAMQQIEQIIQRVAPLSTPVLITGETGVGKEVVARRLHSLGRGGPFMAVNSASIQEGLAESALFGHERGAFTGASRVHRGVFERSQGGTLFLDEIGDMPPSIQARLLRVLQERTLSRVGGEKDIAVDVRLLCATHKDLNEHIQNGHFREDLLYRINAVHLHVPPLRERVEDVLWLSRIFLEKWARKQGQRRKYLTPDAEQAIVEHDWPGNVRDLRHCLERACIFSDETFISRASLFTGNNGVPAVPSREINLDLRGYLQGCEKRYIEHCLEVHDDRIERTATDLGISRKALWEKMKRLGISRS